MRNRTIKPPTFALEVRSEHDYGPAAERAIAAKRADYFTAGTQVVWDVDLLSDDVVSVYQAERPTEPIRYGRADQAHAEPAVPGWSMAVADLFVCHGHETGPDEVGWQLLWRPRDLPLQRPASGRHDVRRLARDQYRFSIRALLLATLLLGLPAP